MLFDSKPIFFILLCLLPNMAGAQDLVIFSPAKEQKFTPGAEIRVQFQSLVPVPLQSAFARFSGFTLPQATSFKPPFDLTVHAPVQEEGTMKLQIVATDTEGKEHHGEVEILVSNREPFDSISLINPQLIITGVAQEEQLRVLGKTASGKQIEVSSAVDGTKYEVSAGKEFISVSENGVVRGLGQGTGAILVRNGKLKTEASVEVNIANSAPKFGEGLSNFSIEAGTRKTVRIQLRDPDGDPLQIESKDLPAFVHLSRPEPNTIELTFSPGLDDGGKYENGFIVAHDPGKKNSLSSTLDVHISVIGGTGDKDQDGFRNANSDGSASEEDNCPLESNSDQADDDGDGFGNVCDNCATVSNTFQTDADNNGMGDACDEVPPNWDKGGISFVED